MQGGLKVSFGPDPDEARKAAHRTWPNSMLSGEAAQILPMPRHFEQLTQLVSEEMMSAMPCGSDLDTHLRAIQEYIDAGFDEVYVTQIGPDQDSFFEFYANNVLPRLR